MCGRYASARRRMELLEEFGVQRDRVETALEPDYNVAPTKPVYAVLTRRSRDAESGAPAAGSDPVRQLRVLRWGLVPSWAKDPSIGSRMINARAETVAEKPSFRRAFARRRCLLPADGFYEWQQVEENGKKRKQPYYIYRTDGRALAFAGLYELWRDPSVPEDHDGSWLWTTTIITTQATDEVGRIHDRMPMVIAPPDWPDWLDPDQGDAAGLHRLLTPAAGIGLTSHPVSSAVNNVRNNGPELMAATLAVPDPGGPEPPPGGVPADTGGTLF
ncbi:MAG TPA: SOS response-associated peptidase [Streptosporangiaceae bacterium]